MKYFISIIVLLAGMTAFGSPHRFYAVEEGGDGSAPGIEHTVSIDTAGGVETVTITLRNHRHLPFQPVKAGLKLGIDTYMDHYPEWYDKYFPTLAVCEADHFYGYFQSPSGKVKAVVSADPVASWSIDYNLGYQTPEYWFYGH